MQLSIHPLTRLSKQAVLNHVEFDAIASACSINADYVQYRKRLWMLMICLRQDASEALESEQSTYQQHLQLVMDILTLALYAILGGAYLVVVPLVGVFYLRNRWFVASSIERVLMYGLVFMFFPGFLLVSLFLNFRPLRQEV